MIDNGWLECRMEGERATKRDTSADVLEKGDERCQRTGGPQAGIRSAAQLLQRLAEEILERETAAEFNPNLARGDANLSADFQ